MKKILALLCAAVMLLSLAACSSSGDAAGKEAYVVGICQLVQHEALDAATKGFKDVLIEEFGEDGVIFDEQNAAGDPATCATICNGFVSEDVDLIMANATAALDAARSATNTIPVLGTSITDYKEALKLGDGFDGKVVGTNISGTSDLAPLPEQAAMIRELFPEAKTVGILYCSGEPNSVFQAKEVTAVLEADGVTVKAFTFADSNDVAAVTQSVCDECDVLYIPTDNTAASCTEAINSVAQPAGVPIVCGEEFLCKGCGVATLSISYELIGRATGEMAVRILKGEADVAEMEIGYDRNPVKKYNAALASALNVAIPDDYVAIEG